MAARPPTSAKQHGHGAGNRPRSNGPPLTVATVKYGNNAEMTINLDCRLLDLHLVLSTICNGEAVDLISDKGQVVDMQGMLFDNDSKNDEEEDIRADVLKPKATYFLLHCLQPDPEILIAAGKKHAKSGSKKGPPPLPDDVSLWKMLYAVVHDKLTNDLVLKHSNGTPIPLQLPSSLKERVQHKMAAHIESHPIEAGSRSTIRTNKKGGKH